MTTDLKHAPSRAERLVGFLERDPDNLALLADAAEAAFDEGKADLAASLLERRAAKAPPTPALTNLSGLVAMRRHRFDEAQATFEALVAEHPDDPALRLNLASAKAMLDDWTGADAALDEAATIVSPRAAALKVQALHHLGRLDEALAAGAGFAERFPDDERLMATLSTAAMDAEDLGLARAYAERGGQAPEAMATLGLLTLGEHRVADAEGLFDQALAASPDDPRALLGKGLGRMAEGDPKDAAGYLDRSAETFRTHLGTWVAAGWAYFVAGDYATSRARFEHALAIDDTFSEIHGGLAVLEVVEGRLEEARKRTEVALRLDRKCFSAALATSLLLAAEGDPEAARKIRDRALSTPVDADGRTLAQMMMGFGSGLPRKR
jgi:tetratricopeptide (TPR) repeat protein